MWEELFVNTYQLSPILIPDRPLTGMRGLVKVHVDHAAVVHLDEVFPVVMPPRRESRNAEIGMRSLFGQGSVSLSASQCHLKGALVVAVAERIRLHASKEEGIVDVDLRLLPRPEKSEEAVGSAGPFLVYALLTR